MVQYTLVIRNTDIAQYRYNEANYRVAEFGVSYLSISVVFSLDVTKFW